MIIQNILTFLKALFWHIYSGFPKSSQEEIDHRHGICVNCNFFDHKNSQCLQCGCNLSNKKEFLNKLAWADQACPIGLWSKKP
jgi:hypothetical protein